MKAEHVFRNSQEEEIEGRLLKGDKSADALNSIIRLKEVSLYS